MKKRYKMFIKHRKLRYKEELLKKISEFHDNNPEQYWKLVKQLKNGECGVQCDPCDKISADEWVSHFKKLYNENSSDILEGDIIKELQENEDKMIQNELSLPILESEVRVALNELKPNKAVGLDGISNEILKASCNILCQPLTTLFNDILSQGVYPSSWNTGYIKCLHKAGSHFDTNNYRGITICSNLSKVFSSVLLKRLNAYIDQQNIMKQEQIGFKKGARTADHMFVLKTMIDMYINKKAGNLFVS